jgi:hypothetical protein
LEDKTKSKPISRGVTAISRSTAAETPAGVTPPRFHGFVNTLETIMNPIFKLHTSVYLTAIGMPLPRSERSECPEHDDVFRKDVAVESHSLLTRAKTGLRGFLKSLRPVEGQAHEGFHADRWLGP